MAVIMCVLGHTVTSVAAQQCPAGPAALWVKHRPWLCMRDLGQPAINKHHVSITHGLHVSCFLFVLRRRLPHRHGECPNNGEDTEQCRDAIMEVKKRVFLYHMSGRAEYCGSSVWALRNDRNAEPSALLLSGGWVLKSTGAESFPGTGFSPVWAKERNTIFLSFCCFLSSALYMKHFWQSNL